MKFKSRIFITILALFILVVTECNATTTSKYTSSVFSKLLSNNISVLNSVEEKNDIVYCNLPNGLNVYKSPKATQDNIIGTIPFLWSMDRSSIIGTWSIISYNCEKAYVKTDDVMLQKEYDIKEYNYDLVYVGNHDTNVFTMPCEFSEQLGTISSNWSVDRILTLDSGWTMISYDCETAFVKTEDLIQKTYIGDFQITYYCPCNICNGSYGAVDRFGNPLTEGTAAVDPSIFNFGDVFQIADERICVAKDVGGAIKGNHIDVFVNVPHNVCENMGNGYKPVYMLKQCN